MNICQVCISDGWAGAETVVYELAWHLRDKGENVSLVLNHEIVKYYNDLKNVKLFDIGCLYPPDSNIPHVMKSNQKRDFPTQFLRLCYRYLDEWLRYRYYKKIKDRLMQFLLENQIDIVHSHIENSAIMVSTLNTLESPTIITVHGEYELVGITPVYPLVSPLVKWQARKFRQALAKVNRVTGVSDFIINAWSEQGVEFKNKPTVIYNGINIADIKNSSSLKVDLKGKLNLLFPGGAKWHKGGDLLIAALVKVKPEIPDFHLYIALDVPQRSLIRKMVNDLGLESNVTFSGFLLKEEYQKLLNSVDIFILPSRSEAFGITILEAMALGKPVIASSRGGIPEMIHDGRNGILVEPNPEQIASAILYLHRNADIRREISRNNLQDAARFDWNLITDQYIDIYQQMLKEIR
jgi:glycosyltransferase involved in cell wall biosynthesis